MPVFTIDEVSFDENDPYCININVSSNPFTPAEINDIRFLELSKTDGLSTGVSDHVREYINHLLHQNGGKIQDLKTNIVHCFTKLPS